MDKKIIRLLEMFIRVHQFGVAHSTSFPNDSRGKELFGLLAAVISEMQGHASAQESGKSAVKERTTLKQLSLERLRDYVETTSRTARAISLTIPGFADRFPLPKHLTEQECLATANSFLGRVESDEDEFLKRGLPADFFEKFRDEIIVFGQLLDGQAQKIGDRVAARAAISEAAERGRKLLRELDVVVPNAFVDNPAARAEWESASHIERAPRHAAAKPPAPPAPAGA